MKFEVEKDAFCFDGYEFGFQSNEDYLEANGLIGLYKYNLLKKLKRKRIAKKKLNWYLLASIILKDEEALLTAISRGADVNFQDKFGWTPLMFAVKYDNIFAIMVLLEAGADIKYIIKDKDKEYDGKNVLHIAYLTMASPYIIEYLIKRGADPNVKDIRGKLPEYYGSGEAMGEAIEKVFDLVIAAVEVAAIASAFNIEGDEE